MWFPQELWVIIKDFLIHDIKKHGKHLKDDVNILEISPNFSCNDGLELNTSSLIGNDFILSPLSFNRSVGFVQKF